jgi:hypothetical protein
LSWSAWPDDLFPHIRKTGDECRHFGWLITDVCKHGQIDCL